MFQLYSALQDWDIGLKYKYKYINVYSPFFTGHFNYITQLGATGQIVNHVRLIRRCAAVFLCSIETTGRPVWVSDATSLTCQQHFINSHSLVQTRSGWSHCPPEHLTRPVPLVWLYPTSQAKVTEAPSGKKLWTSASSLRLISTGSTGLTQSAAGKNSGDRTGECWERMYLVLRDRIIISLYDMSYFYWNSTSLHALVSWPRPPHLTKTSFYSLPIIYFILLDFSWFFFFLKVFLFWWWVFICYFYSVLFVLTGALIKFSYFLIN